MFFPFAIFILPTGLVDYMVLLRHIYLCFSPFILTDRYSEINEWLKWKPYEIRIKYFAQILWQISTKMYTRDNKKMEDKQQQLFHLSYNEEIHFLGRRDLVDFDALSWMRIWIGLKTMDTQSGTTWIWNFPWKDGNNTIVLKNILWKNRKPPQNHRLISIQFWKQSRTFWISKTEPG